MTLSPTTFAGVSPAIAADHSRHVHHTAAWRVNSDVASRGHTTTLQGAWLDPFTVVDASVQRELVPGVLGFLSAENIGDTKYQVNIAGTGAAALVSYGMPRTIRAGVVLER